MTKRQSRHSVMPDAFNFPSVIPKACPRRFLSRVFNRESKSSPMQAHTNKGTTKQDPGFPLTLSPTFVIGETGGNDRGDPAGMTKRPGGNDREDWRYDKEAGGMTERQSRPSVMPPVFNPPSVIPKACPQRFLSRVGNPPLSFPTLVIGNPWLSPMQGPHK